MDSLLVCAKLRKLWSFPFFNFNTISFKNEISSNTERENRQGDIVLTETDKKKAYKNASLVKYIILQHSAFLGLVRSEYSSSQTHAGKKRFEENMERKKSYINDDDIKTF